MLLKMTKRRFTHAAVSHTTHSGAPTVSSGSTASWALPAYTTSDMNTAMGSDMPLLIMATPVTSPQAPCPGRGARHVFARQAKRRVAEHGPRAGPGRRAHAATVLVPSTWPDGSGKPRRKSATGRRLPPARCRVVRRRAPPSPQATVTPSGPDAKICPQRSLDKRWQLSIS